MSQMSFEDAVNAINADTLGNSEKEPDTDINVDQANTVNDVEERTTEESSESQIPEWNLDINALPDDVRPFAKSLQGDYTRKSQAVAELRKQYEGFGDPESVEQAIALARAFQQDPVNTLKQVELGLREMGMLEDIKESSTNPVIIPDDPILAKLSQQYEQDDPLFELAKQMHSSLSELKSEKEVFQRERQEAEQAHLQREREEYLSRTEIALRQAHPDWIDDDLDAVYDLVLSTGGDMEKAGERYDEILNRTLTRYLQKKSALPTSTGAISSSSPGTQGEQVIKTTAEATKLALEELRSLENLGDFTFSFDE